MDRMQSSNDYQPAFDPNAVPFLIQCLKNCISTRNSQQQTANATGMSGEDSLTRGTVAKQALMYLANMSAQELGSLNLGNQTLGSFGLAANRAAGIGSRYATNVSNSPTFQKYGNMASQARSNVSDLGSAAYGNATRGLNNMGSRMSGYFGTRRGGRKGKHHTRKHHARKHRK